jgi:hypothetical protein
MLLSQQLISACVLAWILGNCGINLCAGQNVETDCFAVNVSLLGL